MSTYLERLVQAVKDGRVQLDDILEPGMHLQVRRLVKKTPPSNSRLLEAKDGYTLSDLSNLLDIHQSTIDGQIRKLEENYQIGMVKNCSKKRRLFSKEILKVLTKINEGRL